MKAGEVNALFMALFVLVSAAVHAQNAVLDTTSLTVTEGDYASVAVTLDSAPAGTAQVTVAKISGDADLVASTVVLFALNVGSYKLALYDTEAPLTVANLLNYVNDGDYDATVIHRSVPGFVVQGGGYRLGGNGLEHIPTDPPVQNEYALSNLRATVAMAKTGGDPDSATSEWFVNLTDNSSNLDFQNGGFTVFGEVIENGMALIDAIANLDRANVGGGIDSLPYVTQDGVNYYVMVNQASVVASTELTFTTDNWDTPQTVTFRAIPDSDLENGTAVFRCQAPGNTTDINVAEADDDAYRILVSPATPAIPENGSANLGVRLSAQPSQSVTVRAVHSGGDSDLTVASGGSLTFTTSNWQTEQLVTLAAATDADVSSGTARIRFTAAEAPTVDVTASEADDDVLTVIADTVALTVAEGQSKTVSLHLSNSPTDTVYVQAELSGSDADLTVSGRVSLAFNASNWDVDQTITVEAAEDDDDDADGADTLTFSFSTTADPTAAPLQIPVQEKDDDIAVVLSAIGPGSVSPAGTALVDTDRTSLSVRGIPDQGAVFFEWTTSGGVSLAAPRIPRALIHPETPGTLTAHFAADTDADGLPDPWEQEQVDLFDDDAVTDLADLAPDDDLDLDGFSNCDELLNGTSPLEYVIPLLTDWNLVGFAHRPEDPRTRIVFRDRQGTPVLQGPVWQWDTAGRAPDYAAIDDVASNRGYWVRALADTDILVVPQAAPPSNTIQLEAGWNLIAIPFKPVDNSVATVFGNSILGSVWQFSAGGYQAVTHVVPLRGYWVYATAPTPITISDER